MKRKGMKVLVQYFDSHNFLRELFGVFNSGLLFVKVGKDVRTYEVHESMAFLKKKTHLSWTIFTTKLYPTYFVMHNSTKPLKINFDKITGVAELKFDSPRLLSEEADLRALELFLKSSGVDFNILMMIGMFVLGIVFLWLIQMVL